MHNFQEGRGSLASTCGPYIPFSWKLGRVKRKGITQLECLNLLTEINSWGEKTEIEPSLMSSRPRANPNLHPVLKTKLYDNADLPACSVAAFPTAAAEPIAWSRDHMAWQAWRIYCLALHDKIASLWNTVPCSLIKCSEINS